jgi:GAF domain-containing protein
MSQQFSPAELNVLRQTPGEHSRLQELEHEKQVLERLMEASTALLSEQSLPEILDIILQGVKAIGFDRVCLYLLSEDRHKLIGWAQAGMDVPFVGHQRPLETDRYMQILLADPRPHLFKRENGQLLPFDQVLAREEVKQWACVPLVLRRQVIGKLSIDNKFSQRPIMESDLGPIALFASQAAAAIENARLRDREQAASRRDEEHTYQLKALHQILAHISSTLTLDEILAKIVESACKLTGTELGTIYLIDEISGDPIRAVEFPIAQDTRETPRKQGGLTSLVIHSGEPIIVLDAQRDVRVRQTVKDEQVKSLMGVPLKIRIGPDHKPELRTIGVLFVDTRQPREFNQRDLELLESLASQAAIVIEKARLYDEVAQERDRSEELAKQLLTLHAITHEIQLELNLPKLLNLISKLAAQLLEADAGGILLLDEAKQHLTFHGAYGLSRKVIEGTRDLVGGSIAGRVVETGQAIIANDIPHDPRFYNPAADGEALLAIMSIPLRVGGQIIGTLDVHSKTDRFAFNEDDLQILSLMATQAAIAIQNVRLFDESKRRTHALESLHRISLEITSHRQIPQLIESILERAIELLRAEGGGLYALDEADQSFSLVGALGKIKPLVGSKWAVGDGVVGQVIKTKIPLAISDYRNWPDRLHQYDQYGFSAVAVAPIAWQDKVWGAIAVHDDVANRIFSQEDLNLLAHLGNWAAIALENAELADRDAKKLRRLEQLSQASSEIMGNLGIMSLDERLNLITKHATEILEAETCAIFLVKHPGFLSLEASYGHREGFFERGREFAIRTGPRSGLVGHIAYEGKLFNARGEELTGHFAAKKGPYHAPSKDHYSALAIPLKQRDESGEKLIGLLRADNKKDGNGQAGPTVGFTQEDEWILSLFANTIVVAIEGAELVTQLSEQKDYLAHLHQIADRRGQLLAALDETSRKIRGEKETIKLLQDVVGLAAQLVDCTVGGLYLNRPQLAELELRVTYGLPQELVGQRLLHTEGLIGLVARTGQPKIIHDYSAWSDREKILDAYNFETMVGIPLKQAGEIEAVLFVADTGQRQIAQTDLEILERFAVQAAIALQTSRLLSQEQRMFRPLSILHKISDYIQAARDLDKILHVVLTGITAGYGLGFNRAALLLLDERCENLMGRMGIGHLAEMDAQEDWHRHDDLKREDFKEYLNLLEQDALPLTPIGERMRGLRLLLTGADADVFSQVVLKKKYILVTQERLDQLPEDFVEAFEPALPLIVAPLVAGGQPIGLLVADNKFTRSPITPEDIESLLTFANTAAVVIDNIRLFKETEVARERLRSFYEASNTLVSSGAPERVLRDTVERARIAAGASGASIILIDQMSQARYLITVGTDEPVKLEDLIRPNGRSMQVIRTGQPEIIEDASRERKRVNPSVFWHNIAAALCLPVSLEGKRIGIMWIHYDQPRRFSRSEIEALQLYVNQAAIAYDSARRIKELKYLHQAAEALAGAAGLPEVLEQIVHNACEMLQADSTIIWSYDAIQDKFILERSVAVGILAEQWREYQKVGPRRRGTTYMVMERGWIGVTDIDDAGQYSFLGGSTPKFLKQIGTQSFQGIALVVDEEMLGVLYVNYNHPRSFSEEEQEIARTFANYAALALKKARLFDQVSKARNTARIVAEVTTIGDLDKTLHSIAEGTLAVVNCDAVTLYIYDQDKDKLSHPPTMIGVRYPEKASRFPEVPPGSIVFKMLYQEQPYLVNDVAMDALFKDTRFVLDEEIKTCVAIPLMVGTGRVGVMFVNFRTLHHFTDDELINIGLFAHQAAVAIRNAQLYERVQKRARALETLYEAGRAVTSSLNSEEILRVIAEQSWRLMDTSRFSNLALITGNNMKSVAAYPPEHFSGIQKVIGNIDLTGTEPIGIMGRAVKTGQTCLIGDITGDNDYIKYDPDTLSELAVPIKHGVEIMGVINVEASERNAFDEEDQRTLESLAAQAAIAIENAGLFEQTQRRTHLLDAAAQVARGATAILNMDELLHETARLIVERFDCYHAGVFLLDNEGEYAVLRAAYPKDDPRLLKPDHKLRVGDEGIIGFVAQAGKPHFAPDVSQDPYYIPNLPLTQAEMAFPLIARERVIGVLDVQSVKVGEWRDEDIATLQTMADQLANAIHNAQLYQQITERLAEVNTLQHVAVSLAGALELNDVLGLIMSGAMRLTNTPGVSVLLWDAQQEKFTQGLRIDEGGVLYPYEIKARSKGGIARKIMDERRPVVIPDARQVSNFNPTFFEQGYLSSLGAPLICQDKAIGVLYVHDREPRQFSERQIIFLEALASQAAVAIDRARHYEELKQTYEELKRTKGLVGTRTALAWMGMANSTWRHAIDKHALTIREQTQLLRRNLNEVASAKPTPQLNDRLATIERLAGKILEKPLTPPLTAEEGVEPVTINDLIGERAKQLWQNEPYKTAILQIDLQLSGAATVKISREWLRRAFDILVDNAVDAVTHREIRAVVIGTRAANNNNEGVEIFVSDTGPGLPPKIQAKIGLEVIEKPEDARGLGMGLLMAQTIVQTYNGQLRVGSTGPTGTEMIIWLPLENKGISHAKRSQT